MLKLQEPPDLVPNGEMPRHVLLSVERSLVDRIAPGTRVHVLGVSSIYASASKGVRHIAVPCALCPCPVPCALCLTLSLRDCVQRAASASGVSGSAAASVRTPYLKVVGLAAEEDGAGRTTTQFTPDEEEMFRSLARCAVWLSGCLASSYVDSVWLSGPAVSRMCTSVSATALRHPFLATTPTVRLRCLSCCDAALCDPLCPLTMLLQTSRKPLLVC